MISTSLSPKTINCHGKLIDLSEPKVMGILNITEDSFYDGGKYLDENLMLQHVESMLKDGADIIDLGAQSTRPGATLLDANTEIQRLSSPIKSIIRNFPNAILSVDTFYSEVAKMAIDQGASIINDVSAGSVDNEMFKTVAELQIPYILMHAQGSPETMQESPQYENVYADVFKFFVDKTNILRELGVKDIILDPGFGFGKTLEHNYELLNNLEFFHELKLPTLVGVSRKSMINKVLECNPSEALNGTSVINTMSLMTGANILRVHDVKEAKEAIKIVSFARSVQK